MLNKYPLLSIYNENGLFVDSNVFFIVKLELNESKQTVEKIKYFINQQILKTIFRYSVSSCLRQT